MPAHLRQRTTGEADLPGAEMDVVIPVGRRHPHLRRCLRTQYDGRWDASRHQLPQQLVQAIEPAASSCPCAPLPPPGQRSVRIGYLPALAGDEPLRRDEDPGSVARGSHRSRLVGRSQRMRRTHSHRRCYFVASSDEATNDTRLKGSRTSVCRGCGARDERLDVPRLEVVTCPRSSRPSMSTCPCA